MINRKKKPNTLKAHGPYSKHFGVNAHVIFTTCLYNDIVNNNIFKRFSNDMDNKAALQTFSNDSVKNNV